MSVQDQLLDITIVGCRNLKDTEFFSKQDPYVIVEYAGNKYRTNTDTDGGRHPSFNEKFVIPLIDGLREVHVAVWNSNTLTADDFIGSGKILLQKALSDGFHDSSWPLTTKRSRRAGEIRVILHYTKPNKGGHTMTSAQHAAIVNPAPAMYPPSIPPYYPQAGYAASFAYPPPQPRASEYVYHSYVPYPACHSHGSHGYTACTTHGGQTPTTSNPYPLPMYPPQGYGGYSAPPAGSYYPPPY